MGIANRVEQKEDTMKRSAATQIFLIVTLFLAGAVIAHTETKFEKLDCPGSVLTQLRAINDLGVMIGNCENSKGTHGFTIIHNSLKLINAPNATFTNAVGLNNLNDVVGRYVDKDKVGHGYVFRNGKFTTFDPPGSVDTRPRAINDLGNIVGFYFDSAGIEHGFLWDGNGYHNIEVPTAIGTACYGINVLGVVVGESFHEKNSIGYLKKGKVFKTVNVANGSYAIPNSINVLGQIVGGWGETEDERHGFILNGGKYTTFDFPDALATEPFGINTFGQIVGGYLGTDNKLHGFRLTGMIQNQ
jgi:uncharacterized membrane protein